MQRWNAEILRALSKKCLKSDTSKNWCRRVAVTATVLAMAASAYCQGGGTLDYRGDSHVISATPAIKGTATGSPVQAARAGKDFHILVKGLPAGETMQLELGFAELENSAPGVRTFDLFINDKRALQNFDIAVEAGGPNRSVIRKFSITPPDGTLDFHFVAGTGEAAVNYIRITGEGVNKLISAPSTVSAAHVAEEDEPLIPPDQQAEFTVESAQVHVDDTVQGWTNGMPLGGVGTGKFEILPNGQFANFTINNSWDLPVLRAPGTFVAVAAKATSRGGTGRILQVNPRDAKGNRMESDYPSMKQVDFKGNLPVSSWDFGDEKFPLKVTLSAWSPVAPYDLDSSSLPAGLVNVIVENPNKYPVSTAVALSWEDLNGRGGSLLPGDQHGYIGRSTHQDAATSAVTGFQISSDYLQQSREATFTGNYFVGTPMHGTVITRKLSWNPRSNVIPWWKQFTSRLRLDRIPSTPATVTPEARIGPTASTLCVSFNMAPKEVRRVPFIVSWYMPQIVTMDAVAGTPSVETPDYAARFGSSAGVASYVAMNRVEMRKATDDWMDMIHRATVPQWLKTHALNSLFPFKSNSILLKNQRFAMLESPADMKGMLGPVDLRLYSADFLRSFYPEQEKTELNLYARAQDSSGRIPRYVGNIHGALSGFDAKLLGNDWYDPTACWLLQVAAYWRETGDSAFVDSIKPQITRARDYLVKGAKDGSAFSALNIYSATGEYSGAAELNKVDVLAGLRAAQALLQENPSEVDRLIADQSKNIDLAQTTATFAALLGGDLALRQAGLAPLFAESSASSFVQSVLTNNFAAKPVPALEAGADGAVTDGSVSFPALLQQSVGALGYAAGVANNSIDPYLRMFQVAYAAQKAPWKQALRYDVPLATKAVIRYHRAAMGAWGAWRALSGVVHDVPNQRLYLNPHAIDSTRPEIEMPVFTPAFWGWLKYHAGDSTGTLAVTKVNPGFTSPTLQSVAQGLNPDGTPRNLVTFTQPFVIEEGATLQLDGWPGTAGGKVHPQEPLLNVETEESTSSLSLENEATTSTEEGTKKEKSGSTTSRESEPGEEMAPTPEQDEPMPDARKKEEE